MQRQQVSAGSLPEEPPTSAIARHLHPQTMPKLTASPSCACKATLALQLPNHATSGNSPS